VKLNQKWLVSLLRPFHCFQIPTSPGLSQFSQVISHVKRKEVSVPIDLTNEWIGAFFATTENTGGWMYVWSYGYMIQQLHIFERIHLFLCNIYWWRGSGCSVCPRNIPTKLQWESWKSLRSRKVSKNRMCVCVCVCMCAHAHACKLVIFLSL